jgi:hypothetical protein
MEHSKLQKQLAEIFVLSSSLINRLDEINITESGKELKEKAEQFTQVLEPLLEKFYNSKVSQTNVFTELEKKIDYVLNKNIKLQ